MTTAQVVETSVTVNNNSPIQDYVHLDDQTQPFEMTPGFKPFTIPIMLLQSLTAVNYECLWLFIMIPFFSSTSYRPSENIFFH